MTYWVPQSLLPSSCPFPDRPPRGRCNAGTPAYQKKARAKSQSFGEYNCGFQGFPFGIANFKSAPSRDTTPSQPIPSHRADQELKMKPIAVLVTGFMLLASGVGLATDHGNVVALSSPSANAMGGIHKSLPLPRPSSLLHPNNSTTTAPTATTLRTIYTSSPNVTVQPLSMRIYNLTAYVDKQAKHAQ